MMSEYSFTNGFYFIFYHLSSSGGRVAIHPLLLDINPYENDVDVLGLRPLGIGVKIFSYGSFYRHRLVVGCNPAPYSWPVSF